MIKRLVKGLTSVSLLIDIILAPITLVGAGWLRVAKFLGIKHLPLTRKILFTIGCFPIVDHYYEPLFNFNYLKNAFDEPRNLEGIAFNESLQLRILSKFNFKDEILAFPKEKINDKEFFLKNGSYSGSDAMLLYAMIRQYKPKKIIEVGSGFSTLLMLKAIDKNREEDQHYMCQLICIEPYEVDWLEELPVTVIRRKVEEIDISFFRQLEESDFLFIDSSHVIRPQGDVLHEILSIVPQINVGVFIHFHDIFTPYDYPESWLKDEYRFWNEQYMLEAFLSFNSSFEILFALNFMINKHYDKVQLKFPMVTNKSGAAFWIRKVK